MLVIRPVAPTDVNDLLVLAHKAGKGMTSLPTCTDTLAKRIQLSCDSFANEKKHAADYFLLVMEDTDTSRVIGTAGVYAQTGSRQAFYAYRLMSVTHYSHSLGKEMRSEMLHLTNDYTDCSEVGTLFLDPDYRGNGHWLSKARYLLMGQFQQRFQPYVIAELRGCVDEQGKSPFWHAIGQHFFDMEFAAADALSGTGSNQFITELMPKHPIYTCMLPKAAREVIGKPNPAGRRAMQLLENEGFDYDKVVDIFDGGPLLKGRVCDLQSVRHIAQGTATASEERLATEPTLVATSTLKHFCVIYTQVEFSADGLVKLCARDLDALGVSPGALLRFIQPSS